MVSPVLSMSIRWWGHYIKETFNNGINMAHKDVSDDIENRLFNDVIENYTLQYELEMDIIWSCKCHKKWQALNTENKYGYRLY